MAAAAVCHPPLAFAVRWPCCASGAGGVPTRTAAAASSCGRAVAPTTAPRACSRCASVAGRRCGWAGGGGARAPMCDFEWSPPPPPAPPTLVPPEAIERQMARDTAALLTAAAHGPLNAWSFVAPSDFGLGLWARAPLRRGQAVSTPGRGCRAACSGAARARFRSRAPTPPLPALRGSRLREEARRRHPCRRRRCERELPVQRAPLLRVVRQPQPLAQRAARAVARVAPRTVRAAPARVVAPDGTRHSESQFSLGARCASTWSSSRPSPFPPEARSGSTTREEALAQAAAAPRIGARRRGWVSRAKTARGVPFGATLRRLRPRARQ